MPMIWAIILQVNMTLAGPIVVGQVPAVPNSISQPSQMQMYMLKRVSKRHSSFQEIVAKELNTPFAWDWSNPCGGLWLGDKHKKKHNNKQHFKRQKSLRIARNAALRESRSLPLKTKAINISDINNWKFHKKTYNFLPTINMKSNITLRSWHRHLQVYIAAFGYLHRASLFVDQTQHQFETDISKVLRFLKLSARNVLCEIETAINATATTSLVNNNNKNHNKKQRPLLNMKPKVMLERLQFQMPFKGQLNTQNGSIEWKGSGNSTKVQLNALDLKFTKHRYLSYLRSIVNVLKKHRVIKVRKQLTSTQHHAYTYT